MSTELTVGTGASAAQEIATELNVENVRIGGNSSQAQEISTQAIPTTEQVFDIVADPGC